MHIVGVCTASADQCIIYQIIMWRAKLYCVKHIDINFLVAKIHLVYYHYKCEEHLFQFFPVLMITLKIITMIFTTLVRLSPLNICVMQSCLG